MKFTKYTSIENHYRDNWIEKIKDNINPKTQFVVLEKVHGANFSFITDGENVRVAKRTCLLDDKTDFFGANKILKAYRMNVIDLFHDIYSENPDSEVVQIQVFGEIFGGSYNGKSENAKLVQREVQYIPFNDFLCFDIRVTYSDGSTFYLTWLDVRRMCGNNDIKIVPQIFIGTLEECLEQKNDYITLVPELYGLEPIENNITEGNVIKPLGLSLTIGSDRVIIKSKNDKFREKGRVKTKNKSTAISDEDRKWLDEITKYFEPTRLDALFSKGEVKRDIKEIGKISGLFFKDVMDDFIKDNQSFLELDKKIRKYIQNLAQNECRKYVRDLMFKED